MVAIIADTTASIPANLIEELEIDLVPYYIMRNNETLRDGIDIQPDEFAQYLMAARTLPTTSNPSPGDYVKSIRKLAERTREIVAITMTSKASGAYQSCRAAVAMVRERMPHLNIDIIDTLQVAMCHGWAVIEAARVASQGFGIKEVAQKAREIAAKTTMIQTADTLRYLYMGGRIGKAQNLMGTLLNIKPIIGMEDGLIVPLGTARTRHKVYMQMIEMVREKVGQGGRIKIAFTHCAAMDQLEILKEEFSKHFQCVEVLVSALSPALAVHSGPGTVGLSFYPD
ncbi:MAG: DegV family protein [Anaerolineales bacterium]|nr:DegV family protein [Anaerolineales bacterium]